MKVFCLLSDEVDVTRFPASSDLYIILQNTLEEVIRWRDLNHSRIVRFLGFLPTSNRLFPNRLCLISAFSKLGNLASYLRANPGANKVELVRRSAIIRELPKVVCFPDVGRGGRAGIPA